MSDTPLKVSEQEAKVEGSSLLLSASSVPDGSCSQTAAGVVSVKQEPRINEEQINKEQAEVKEEPGDSREELAANREEMADEKVATHDQQQQGIACGAEDDAACKDENQATETSCPLPSDDGKLIPVTNRFKKRKVAVFMSYVGFGYSGMQHNPGFKTIEGELLPAFHRAGAIADTNVQFDKVHWKRSARTDKGVSAACNVVSAHLVLEPPGLIERVNAELPEQIRIHGIERTTNSFDARLLCDMRRYEYILPVWAFDPECCRGRSYYFNKTQQAEAVKQEKNEAEGVAVGAVPMEEDPAAAAAAAEPKVEPKAEPETTVSVTQDGERAPAAEPVATTSLEAPTPEADAAGAAGAAGDSGPISVQMEGSAAADGQQGQPQQESKAVVKEIGPNESTYVFGPEEQQRLNRLLGKYVGTLNFHNFTVQVSPNEARANRHILSFDCETFEAEGIPYVRMTVLGASFMLHQIRKMVGMVVAVMRGIAPEECMDLALSPTRDCKTPMAPALGLFLVECIYRAYNQRWAGQEGREAIQAEKHKEKIDAFKAKYIYPHMVAQDKEEEVNANFLRSLNDANYKFSTWKDNDLGFSKKTLPPKSDGGGGEAGTKRKYEHKSTDFSGPGGAWSSRPKWGRGGRGRRGRGGGRGGRGRIDTQDRQGGSEGSDLKKQKTDDA